MEREKKRFIENERRRDTCIMPYKYIGVCYSYSALLFFITSMSPPFPSASASASTTHPTHSPTQALSFYKKKHHLNRFIAESGPQKKNMVVYHAQALDLRTTVYRPLSRPTRPFVNLLRTEYLNAYKSLF